RTASVPRPRCRWRGALVRLPGRGAAQPVAGAQRLAALGAYYLIKGGIRQDQRLAQCPQTAALLAAAPLAEVPGEAPTAFFSILEPRTRIPPHTGVTNTRLVVHVPLVVPPGCGFRVIGRGHV